MAALDVEELMRHEDDVKSKVLHHLRAETSIDGQVKDVLERINKVFFHQMHTGSRTSNDVQTDWARHVRNELTVVGVKPTTADGVVLYLATVAASIREDETRRREEAQRAEASHKVRKQSEGDISSSRSQSVSLSVSDSAAVNLAHWLRGCVESGRMQYITPGGLFGVQYDKHEECLGTSCKILQRLRGGSGERKADDDSGVTKGDDEADVKKADDDSDMKNLARWQFPDADENTVQKAMMAAFGERVDGKHNALGEARRLHDTHETTTEVTGQGSKPDLIITTDRGLTPTSTVALIELKKSKAELGPLNRDDGQTVLAAARALRQCPQRQHILAMLTNLRQSRLYRVERAALEENDPYDFSVTRYGMTGTTFDTVTCLTALMFVATDEALGVPMGWFNVHRSGQEEQERYVVDKSIGSGNTSDVFALRRDEGDELKFAKVFKQRDVHAKEMEVLTDLLKAKRCPFDSFALYESTRGIPVIMGSPVLDPIEITEMDPYKWVDVLWAIRGLAELGFVHRDVRPANFLLVHPSDKRIRLIDYAYAVQAGENQPFSGTITYASERVLKRLADDPNAEFAMSHADDLESFVKCYLSWTHTKAWDEARQNGKPDSSLSELATRALERWATFVADPRNQGMGRHIEALLGHAREGDAESIATLIRPASAAHSEDGA